MDEKKTTYDYKKMLKLQLYFADPRPSSVELTFAIITAQSPSGCPSGLYM